MSVYSIKRTDYICRCDKCHKMRIVPETTETYNGPQAVRSLGWSYTRYKTVLCDKCRKENWKDRHTKHYP